MQAFVAGVKAAMNQVANHFDQLIQTCALCRHFRVMANGDEHLLVLFDLEDQFFADSWILAHGMNFGKGEYGMSLKRATVWV
jgi:hypothetical protein